FTVASSLVVPTTTTTTTVLDGTGIGGAILDSGMDTGHKAFLGKNDQSRIVFSKDYTGENRIDDPYGHGTHVASIAVGNGRIAEGAYTGVAPNANILNLRVLNSQRVASISAILDALDRVLSNRKDHNLLVTQQPQLDMGVSSVDNRREMQLSGTSMSTPVVAGAAAMLLQANPTLTPNMVKALMMYTAQPLKNFNTFEQGAGELNVEGAMRVARLVRKDFGSSKPIGGSLLTSPVPPVPTTTIAGNTFTWSQGILLGHHFAKG